MLALASALLLGACGKRVTARVPSPPRPARIGDTETGTASWYGIPYDGRKAASGEIFDMRQLTAAHRTLPFETWLEVTNLENGKQVNVRINDRGPFVDGRVIDLSMAAAREIDMLGSGVARVRLKVIAAPPVSSRPESSGSFTVQAGAFSDRRRAEALKESLAFPEVRVTGEGHDGLWRVLVGSRLTETSANTLAAQIRKVVGEALIVRDR